MSTEDIPYLGSLTRKAAHEAASSDARPQVVGRDVDRSAPLFDPGVVELNATMLLRFLQVKHGHLCYIVIIAWTLYDTRF